MRWYKKMSKKFALAEKISTLLSKNDKKRIEKHLYFYAIRSSATVGALRLNSAVGVWGERYILSDKYIICILVICEQYNVGME